MCIRDSAYAVEGLSGALDRSAAFIEAGADAIFAEAMATLDEYQAFADGVDAPILANMTEFGVTPLFTKDELAAHGVGMILYPLSASRAMQKAAEKVYTDILQNGHQRESVPAMQTRMELYDYLDYHDYEQRLDRLFAESA